MLRRLQVHDDSGSKTQVRPSTVCYLMYPKLCNYREAFANIFIIKRKLQKMMMEVWYVLDGQASSRSHHADGERLGLPEGPPSQWASDHL